MTMNGWNDIEIGASSRSVAHYIDQNTRNFSFKDCTNYQSLKDGPRASSFSIHHLSNEVIEFRILGVSKLKTIHGIGLSSPLKFIENNIPADHVEITSESYIGSAITKANMGTRYLVWAQEPPAEDEYEMGMLYQFWRSDKTLQSISVGYFNRFGDTVCD